MTLIVNSPSASISVVGEVPRIYANSSRQIDSLLNAALNASTITPFLAVDLDVSTPVYMWSGYGDLTIGSKTYLGAGQLMSISAVEETTEIQAKGASITVSGIPSSFLSLALTEPYHGRECRIYFGLANDPSGYVEIFSGELDQMNISEEGDTATIQLLAENVLIVLERPVVRRFTAEDQKSRFPADRGLEFVAGIQDKDLVWGRATERPRSSSSGQARATATDIR
jgi:hypothetical protein